MTARPWWQDAVVYQIYPRSFQDSDDDGVGDLPGVLARLDHLAWLGIDAVWLSPIYPSPMADFGYDVSDYCDVHPLFGRLADFDALVAAAHERGLKVILDFVPNHTSAAHPWFREALASRDSPKRDWYIWRDPAPDGGPPNNWPSLAGGPGWAFHEPTGQYYYHAFLKEQPDLDWRNPAVQDAMLDTLRFWLRRGVDGFRVDVIWHLMKDPELRDDPPNPDYRPGEDPPFRAVLPLHSCDHQDVHGVVAAMRRTLDEFPGDRLLIGEIYLPLERLVAYYGEELGGAHLPFNFQLVAARWHAASLRAMIEEYEAALPPGGWPNWVLGNHDQPRIASRVGPAQARVAAMLLLTLRGTPTLYYGDELAMENVPIPLERERDPFGLNMPGTRQGRDPERTPMLWSDAPFAGFSTVEPWLPLSPGWEALHVEAQRGDRNSMLNLVRALLALRRAHPALTAGSLATFAVEGDVLAYARDAPGERLTVALNLDDQPKVVVFGEGGAGGRVLLSTHLDRAGEAVGRELALRPDEGVVLGR